MTRRSWVADLWEEWDLDKDPGLRNTRDALALRPVPDPSQTPSEPPGRIDAAEVASESTSGHLEAPAN